MNANRAWTFAIFGTLIAVCVAVRLTPHAPNATPVTAAALFAAWLTGSWILAAIVPLGAMLLADTWLGGYHLGVMASVYLCMLAPLWMGARLAARPLGWRILAASAGAGTLFFLVTNLAHWLFMGSHPLTAAGLLATYLDALPFAKYTLAGDVAWTCVFFGAWRLLAPGSVRGRLARPVSSLA